MSNIDKKTIVNDWYQAAVISVFVIGYSMLSKKILQLAPQASKVRSGKHGKTGCYCCCIRDDARVSHQTEDPTGTH